MQRNFWLAKPYGLPNQKLCYIQIYKILEKGTKNVLDNGWWISTQVLYHESQRNVVSASKRVLHIIYVTIYAHHWLVKVIKIFILYAG